MPNTGTNCGVPSQNLPLAPSVRPPPFFFPDFDTILHLLSILELALRGGERKNIRLISFKKRFHLKKIKIISYLLQSEISVGFKIFLNKLFITCYKLFRGINLVRRIGLLKRVFRRLPGFTPIVSFRSGSWSEVIAVKGGLPSHPGQRFCLPTLSQ